MENDEDTVITGIAGKLPECENVEEFMKALIGGVDLVTENDRRFKPGCRGLPRRSGTIPIVDKFDNVFFGIPHIAVNTLEVSQRLVLESVYECIVDAAVNPKDLRGTQTGVYVGLGSFDNVMTRDTIQGRSTGILAALASNRISYVFDLKGPSSVMDTAASSGLYALVNAFNDMQRGEVDNAIVCGVNTNFISHEVVEYKNMNLLSPDGKCKSFSKERNGYVKSEALVSIFLQRRKNAKRIYATVVGGKLNSDGRKPIGDTSTATELIRETYEKFKLNVNDFSYFEADATGSKVGDEMECQILQEVFGNRKKPLLIGSVKSNVGHTEVASALCSILKVITAFHYRTIPGNLHSEPLDLNLPGISEDKLKVVTENTPLDDGLVGVNSFSLGGANAHAVLLPHTKPKLLPRKPKNRLVLVSGRTPQAVEHLLSKVIENQEDPEFLALVDELHKTNIDGHSYRGYVILGNNPETKVDKYTTSRPIWFIYTGLGSQWLTMGCSLLKIDVFKKTFDRLAAAMKPYNVDLYHLITTEDSEVFDDVANCFMAICAIQIALTDVLHLMGIFPEKFAGHSLGEAACAYADGNMTAEEAMMLSYARGCGFQRAKSTPKGQMAAIGLSREQVSKILPKDVYIGCVNSSTSVTISGAETPVRDFVEELKSQGIFARNVASCGMSLHTRFVDEPGVYTFEFLKGFIKQPKLRTPKWISTSVPDNAPIPEWGNFNGPEYHGNSFRHPVLFQQIFKHIPKNAIILEVAPHGLLQAILKKELGPDVTNIPITNRTSPDNEHYLLSAIGDFYIAGGQPQLRNFYSDVTFPVGRGTPLISSLVKWDHSVSWFIPVAIQEETYSGIITVNLSNPEYEFLKGNEVHGNVILTGMNYIVMIWKMVATELLMKDFSDIPIVIENISIQRATVVKPDSDTKFLVNIVLKSGNFKMYEGHSLVISGTIAPRRDAPLEFDHDIDGVSLDPSELVLKRNDIYRHFRHKGQKLEGKYKCILESNIDGTKAKIEWERNWDSFLENMLQLYSISVPNCREMIFPSFIAKMCIDPVAFIYTAEINKEQNVFSECQNTVWCDGIEFSGIEYAKAPTLKNAKLDVHLETQEFVYFTDPERTYSLADALRIALQIVLQNNPNVIRNPKVCGIVPENPNEDLTVLVTALLRSQPLVNSDFCMVAPQEIRDRFDILVLNNCVLSAFENKKIQDHLTEEGFIIFKGSIDDIENLDFEIIFEAKTDNGDVYLLRLPFEIPDKSAVIKVSSSSFDWVDEVRFRLDNESVKTVYLYSEEVTSGLAGLALCLYKEAPNIKTILIEGGSDMFSASDEFLKKQLRKNLNVNIARQGRWGTLVYLPFEYIDQHEVVDATLSVNAIGNLESLAWIETPFRNEGENTSSPLVHVFYAGVNLKDVLYASGKILEKPNANLTPNDGDCNFGLEYSGTCNGKKVMGLVKSGAFSLQVDALPAFTWEVPAKWNLEEAATVPVAYVTCYYALLTKCKLEGDQSVLVHLGTGTTGLAGISIALALGCNVFASVNSEDARDAVKEMYPQLNSEQIGLANDESFQRTIVKNTNYSGFDVILNCSANEVFTSTHVLMKYLKENGDYISIQTNFFLNKIPTESYTFMKTCSFHKILLEDILNESAEVKKQIHDFILKGLQTDVIKPLPSKVFSDTDVGKAFKAVLSNKYTEKVLIEVRDENPYTLKSPEKKIRASKKLYFNPKKSYIIIGGTEEFGLELCEWIIRKGGTKIVLNSTKGIINGYQALCMEKWATLNISVVIATGDTTTLAGAEELISRAQSLGPVGGIFNVSLASTDSPIRNQTMEDFESAFKSKLLQVINMDEASRKHCSELDYFVRFSSFITARGNNGQSNYGMANSAIERLCEKRREDLLPALSVQWGPLGDYETSRSTYIEALLKDYVKPQPISSCLATLEKFMLSSHPVCASAIVSVKIKDGSSKSATAAETVADILGIKDIDTVEKSLSLIQLGLDELTAAEVKRRLSLTYKMDLGIKAIRRLTLGELVDVKELSTLKAN